MSSRLRTQHVPRHRRAGVPSSRARLLQASVLMASGSVVSRLLGFVRNFMFGAILAGSMSAAANAFSAANTLPNTIWILRSEEHTSELQSRGHLVCRLLLEKK